MKNIIKLATKAGYQVEEKTFGILNDNKKIEVLIGETIITFKERTKNGSFTVKGYQGSNNKYSASFPGERIEITANTQKAVFEEAIEFFINK